MPVVNVDVQATVVWSQELAITMRHVNLTETLVGVMRGIAQAARGEGAEIDPSALPTDDDK